MVRGEYESWDAKNGIWHKTPNIFTIVGLQAVFGAAFQGDALTWHVGLCDVNPGPVLDLMDIGEPTSANGYLRQSLDQGATDWPTIGVIQNEIYVESKEFTFPATGAYSGAVTRLFLTDGTDVISVSSVLNGAPITYDAASIHRYRLYFR